MTDAPAAIRRALMPALIIVATAIAFVVGHYTAGENRVTPAFDVPPISEGNLCLGLSCMKCDGDECIIWDLPQP